MINVFVCTYNPNLGYLKRTVDAILAQDLSRSEWSFIIIDNNSKIPVENNDFIKEYGINVIVESQQGLTAARRCAVENAAGDVLVFVDDDNIIETNYLSEVVRIFNNKTIGVISGNIEPEYEKKPEKWLYDVEGMLAIRRFSGDNVILNNKNIYNQLFPIGAGMCVRKSVIQDYYNNHLNAANYIEGRKAEDLSSAEDIDLDFFALSIGYHIGVSPMLKSLHIIPPKRVEIKYILKLAKASFRSTCLVNKKWAQVFKHNVFDYFEINYFVLILRLCYHGVLSFSNSHQIRYNYFLCVFRYTKLSEWKK